MEVQAEVYSRVLPFDGDENIKIRLKKGQGGPAIHIDFNQNKLFRTMENRIEIAAAIHKKLNHLVQNHLDKLAIQQEENSLEEEDEHEQDNRGPYS